MSDLLAGTPLEIIPGATVSALVAGAALPLFGLWVVLQRIVFLGVALSQVAAAGVALGLFLGLPPLPLGFVLALATAVPFTSGGRHRQRAGTDAALGAAFCAASALALLFISRSPAEMDEVHHVLHGNLIYASRGDVTLMAVAAGTGLLIVIAFSKEMLFSAFDRETAAAMGVRTRVWSATLLCVLAGVLTISTRTTGSLLSFAMLLLPPFAALQIARTLRGTIALASGLGVAGAAIGLLGAVALDLHLESAITLTLFALLGVAGASRSGVALAVAIAAGLVATIVLQPDAGPQPGPTGGHASHEVLAEPYHVDVTLDDVRGRDGTLAFRWRAAIHRHDPSGELPDALWLVLVLDGEMLQTELVADAGAFADGDAQLDGRVELAVSGRPQRYDAQLWSGPPTSLDARPLAHGSVSGGTIAWDD